MRYEILSINHNCQSFNYFLLSSRSQVCHQGQEKLQNKDVQGMSTDNHSQIQKELTTITESVNEGSQVLLT